MYRKYKRDNPNRPCVACKQDMINPQHNQISHQVEVCIEGVRKIRAAAKKAKKKADAKGNQ